jgi:DNA-binding transcriptional ArsR family regulator
LTRGGVASIFNELVKNQNQTTEVFAALADPTRRRILSRLSASQESTVTNLARPFRISSPAVSRHLRVLERAGLIHRRRAGRVHLIRAQPDGLQAAKQWIEQCAAAWQFSFDKLDSLLSQTRKGSKP